MKKVRFMTVSRSYAVLPASPRRAVQASEARLTTARSSVICGLMLVVEGSRGGVHIGHRL
jgi:hypothetical protein